MRKTVVSILALAALWTGSIAARAADSCEKNELEALIAGAANRGALVSDVAQSVPLDPSTCTVNYCEISSGKPKKVKVAIGAGISDAYAQLLAEGREDEASEILRGACSADCDRTVVTAFAASQAETIDSLCETATGEGTSGRSPSVLSSVGASGIGGGGSAASKN